MNQQIVYNPVPFLLLRDVSLAAKITQQITAPPSPQIIPREFLPSLDAKANARKTKSELLRRERSRSLTQARGQKKLRNSKRVFTSKTSDITSFIQNK